MQEGTPTSSARRLDDHQKARAELSSPTQQPAAPVGSPGVEASVPVKPASVASGHREVETQGAADLKAPEVAVSHPPPTETQVATPPAEPPLPETPETQEVAEPPLPETQEVAEPFPETQEVAEPPFPETQAQPAAETVETQEAASQAEKVLPAAGATEIDKATSPPPPSQLQGEGSKPLQIQQTAAKQHVFDSEPEPAVPVWAGVNALAANQPLKTQTVVVGATLTPASSPAPAPVAPSLAAAPPDPLAALATSLGGGGGDVVLPGELSAMILAAPTAPPASAPSAPGQAPLDPSVNTANHRASAMRLNRFMESAEASKFPHMQKLFTGTRDEACIALKCFENM